MDIIGRTTIHPLPFYTGKGAGYAVWAVLLLEYAGVSVTGRSDSAGPHLLSYALTAAGLALIAGSLLTIGAAARLGLPSDRTELKTAGLYRFSRNPIYAGFHLLTLSAAVYTADAAVAALGAYSITVYHFIILGEERFLRERFGDAYRRYCERVRRYL